MSNLLSKILIFIMLFAFISCTESHHIGDFTIIVEAGKYQSPYRKRYEVRIKTDSYDVLYKGKEINWSNYFPADKGSAPEIWDFKRLEFDSSCLMVEADSASTNEKDYYLLRPSGDDVQIEYLGQASSQNGARYTELLKGGKLFHQVGILINLQTLEKYTLGFNPSGRLLAADEDYSNIIYVANVFDESVKERLDKLNRAAQSHSVKELDQPKNTDTFLVIKWNVKNNELWGYIYTDPTLWSALNKQYESNKYPVISTSYDSNFVFGLFKWEKDSAGETHLIPKNADINTIKFQQLPFHD